MIIIVPFFTLFHFNRAGKGNLFQSFTDDIIILSKSEKYLEELLNKMNSL